MQLCLIHQFHAWVSQFFFNQINDQGPRIQPRGYIVELVDWGGFRAISISKYVNGTWKSMSINLDRLADVLTMVVDLAKRAGVEIEL